MNESQFGKGAIDRPDDFMKTDSFRHEEIAGSFQPATWIEKNPLTGFVTYPKRDQKTQSTCVPYNAAKALSVDELSENGVWRELSPHSLYPYVAGPSGGASSLDTMTLAAKLGMTLEQLYPSDGLSEADMTSDKGFSADAKLIALVYKPGSIVQSGATFETIASILQGYKAQGQKKVVTASIIGQNNGTWLSTFPKPPSNPNDNWYHRISFTDFGLINGKKYLAFDNSWGTAPGNAGQQFLGIEYEPFIYGAIYTLNLPDNWQQIGSPSVPPPTYTWNVNLAVGSNGPDVLALQQALQSMGMFPISSVVKPTGSYYGVTKAGVQLFQAAFGILVSGIVDTQTRQKLNDIF